MSLRGYIMGAAALGLIASHGWTAWHFHGRGYDKRSAEYAAAKADTETELFAASEENSRMALLFEQQSAGRDIRAREFENAARVDPDACLVPDPDELRELDRLWRGGARP